MLPINNGKGGGGVSKKGLNQFQIFIQNKKSV